MSKRNSIRAQQLQSDWEIGGNLHDMLTEALDSEYKRGADNERERLFSASNGLFMGKPFSYWVELEAQRKRYYGLAEPDWMTPGFKAKIRDAFVCEPTEPVLKSEWEQAQAKIAELENAVEFKNEHIERLIAENLKLHSKPAPQLDAEKVKESIEILRDFSCLFGQFYSRPSHWKYEYYENEMRKAVIHLSHELDID